MMHKTLMLLSDAVTDATFVMVRNVDGKVLSMALHSATLDTGAEVGGFTPALWRNPEDSGWMYTGDLAVEYDGEVNQVWQITVSDAEILAAKANVPSRPYERMLLELYLNDDGEPRYVIDVIEAE